MSHSALPNGWGVVSSDGQRHAQAEPGRLSAQMTLVEFFHQYAWPQVLAPKGDSIRTLKDYQKSLAYWKRFTGDPALAAIDKPTCAKYLEFLRAAVGANTVFKHWANVERLLRWIGPAGPQNQAGTGLVQQPPWIQGPKRWRVAAKEALTLDEIRLWLEALPQVARPWQQVGRWNPADWWRAAILVAYNTAMRPGLQFRARWEWFKRYGVMAVPPGVAKGHDGRNVYFGQAALNALEPLRRPTGLLFGWQFPRGSTTFRKYRSRQQRDAGLPENRRLTWYALRRTFATEMAKLNVIAMQIMMNHAGLGTKMALEHYIDEEVVVMRALAQLPQPGRIVQGMLFDK